MNTFSGLRYSGLPLGGIGAGHVELRANGYFAEWGLMNNKPWAMGPSLAEGKDFSFFALQVGSGDESHSVILGEVPPYQPRTVDGFDWLNDPYAMPWLRHATSIDAEMRAPFARLAYKFDALPLEVTLEAWSPFIPQEVADSALPLGFFTFTLRNKSRKRLTVGLSQVLRNLAGYAHADKPSRITFSRALSGRSGALIFDRPGLPGEASDRGQVRISVAPSRGQSVSYLAHPRTMRDFWEPMRESVRLENADIGNYVGRLGNEGADTQAKLRLGLPHGALCVTTAIDPGEEVTVRFQLAWHFPNFWESDYPEKKCCGTNIGHYYSKRFKTVEPVAAYGWKEHDRLLSRSREWLDAFYATSLPRWLLDAVNAQFTSFIKASWLDRKGRFAIWEGLGCCGLQTTDVSYYASCMVLALFPELERSQLDLTRRESSRDDKIPHSLPGTLSCCNLDVRKRIDLGPEYILQVWRDYQWQGDRKEVQRHWSAIETALKKFPSLDTDGDGLPNHTGPDQTYDQFPLRGTSSFVGFIYAAALRAAGDLAVILKKTALAQQLHQQSQEALVELDRQLWTGDHYRLSHDKASKKNNDGVMLDQVNADGFCRMAGGEPLLEEKKVRSALRAVLKQTQRPQGYLVNCSWPDGNGVKIGRHTADQANWPWSGVEYILAGHLASVGFEREALHVARQVWDRYERAGMRFNHIECGQHYYRPMSVWNLYAALTKTQYLGASQTWAVDWHHCLERFVQCFPEGWASLSKTEKGVELRVQQGSVTIRRIRLTGEGATSNIRVSYRGKRVRHTIVAIGGKTELVLDHSITLRAGDLFTVVSHNKRT